jgi:electron transport complex protein RnfC
MANKNPNTGKPGYDKYGVKTMAQRKKEKAQAAKEKIQKERRTKAEAFGKATDARNKAIKSRAQSRKQVEKIKTTMGLNEVNPKKSLPQKTDSQKKRSSAKLSSSIKAKSGEGKYKDARALSKKDIKAEKLALKKQKGSEAPKKQISKQDRRRSLRAADLAVRKDISLDEAKELQGQRRANRKQFLKNFAANLAGVEMNKGEFNTKDYENYKKNNDENAESNIVSDQQKSNKIDTESNTKRYKSLFESMANTPNSTLGNMSYLDDLEV